MIGTVLKKTISGGERKRCSIGVELVTDPSVVLLDEPTSGLDSFMALSVCRLLMKLAHEQGKTIISTIH
jgi:ABC-type multidrug transport system ATPase subunit